MPCPCCEPPSPCAIGCDAFPTLATVSVNYTGFDPIPEVVDENYRHAREGCPPASGTLTSSLMYYPGDGWFEGSGFDWSGSNIITLRNAGFSINCNSPAAGFTAFFLAHPWDDAPSGHWIPQAASEFRSEAWVAWINESFAAGKYPSQLCRNICGSYQEVIVNYIFDALGVGTIPVGSWTIEFTLGGCGNPLP